MYQVVIVFVDHKYRFHLLFQDPAASRNRCTVQTGAEIHGVETN